MGGARNTVKNDTFFVIPTDVDTSFPRWISKNSKYSDALSQSLMTKSAILEHNSEDDVITYGVEGPLKT